MQAEFNQNSQLIAYDRFIITMLALEKDGEFNLNFLLANSVFLEKKSAR